MRYERLSDSDVWHWNKCCTSYPKEGSTIVHKDVEHGRPQTGELCNQCLAKERRANLKAGK